MFAAVYLVQDAAMPIPYPFLAPFTSTVAATPPDCGCYEIQPAPRCADSVRENRHNTRTPGNKRRGAIVVLVMDHVLDDDVMQQPGSFTEGHALPNDDSSVELKIAGAKDCTKIEAGSN